MSDFLKTIFNNQYACGTILAFVGALIGYIFAKFASKMAVISYNVSTAKLGETASNDIHGKIEVSHGGQLLPNFYFSKIKIQNCSTQDLENIRLLLYVGDGVLILSDFIRYSNAVRKIPYSADYASVTANPQDPLFFTRREYEIPVLNRGQTILAELTLTHRMDVAFPLIVASMVHKGVKLIEQPHTAEFHGISIRRTLPWAIIIGAVSYIGISTMCSNIWLGSGIMLLYGFFAQSISAYVLKGGDKISRILGITPPIS
jgi:hypothetical protein